MNVVKVMGIDLAKSVFQLHGINESGKVILRRCLGRQSLVKFMSNLSPCVVGIEACGGAHYWARELVRYGHTVRMMAPQYVKPYVKTNKNDSNDAEAICEAVQRPNMRFVCEKTVEQQSVQMLHRSRSYYIKSRTMLCNEIRAFLIELGIAVCKGKGQKSFRREVSSILLSNDPRLNDWSRDFLSQQASHLDLVQGQVEKLEERIEKVFNESATCKRLVSIPGVGSLTATAIVAAISDASNFRSGRHLAAWLGLVPRQNSSGGKTRLGCISKRGDTYLRTLLIHGGRAVVRTAEGKLDRRSLWVSQKIQSRGRNKAAVAVANKNARIIWKLLRTEDVYKVAA